MSTIQQFFYENLLLVIAFAVCLCVVTLITTILLLRKQVKEIHRLQTEKRYLEITKNEAVIEANNSKRLVDELRAINEQTQRNFDSIVKLMSASQIGMTMMKYVLNFEEGSPKKEEPTTTAPVEEKKPEAQPDIPEDKSEAPEPPTEEKVTYTHEMGQSITVSDIVEAVKDHKEKHPEEEIFSMIDEAEANKH